MNKQMRQAYEHTRHVNYLSNHLELVGEDKYKLRWVMREGVWLYDNSPRKHTLCDLVLVYDGFGVPIELKHSTHARGKALSQLLSGGEFVRNELGLFCQYGVFVVYDDYVFDSERIIL